MSSVDAGPGDLAVVVSSDPALTAAVLRAANAAAVTPLHRVRTAHDAVVRIGAMTTRRIITGVALTGSFRNVEEAGIDVDSFWLHLIATAHIADALAWPGGQSEAFTAGMLHDLGRLALAAAEPHRYREVMRWVKQGIDPCRAEQVVFGTDHEAWGHAVAEQWSLPSDLAEAIGDHHGGSSSALASVVCEARRHARALGFGDGIMPASAAVSQDTIEAIDVQALTLQIERFRSVVAVAA